MLKFIRYFFAFILTVYISSIIVFAQPENTIYSNIINVFMLGTFILYRIIYGKISFKLNNEIGAYILFIIIGLGSFIWAHDPLLSINMGFRLIFLAINMILIYNIIIEFKIENAFMNGLIIGSFVNYLVLINFIHVGYETILHFRFTGTMGNPNLLAIALIFSILISIIYLKLKKISTLYIAINYINIFLAIYMIFETASKKGIFFGSIILIVHLLTELRSFKKAIFQFSIISIVMFFVFYNVDIFSELIENNIIRMIDLFSVLEGSAKDASTTERLDLINAGLNIFADNPLLGIGLDNFKLINRHYAHNNYVELLSDVGLLGLVAYYIIFYFLVKKYSLCIIKY